MGSLVDPLLISISSVLHREHIPIIVWGDVAMQLCNIPTSVMRIDVLVPDDMLTRAASSLEAEGWTVSTGPLPLALAGFWQSGWDVVGKACRRFHYPPFVEREDDDTELLILPTSFVGLGPSPSLDSEEYTRVKLFGPNVYQPSSHLMAESIARTHIRHAVKGTNFSYLLRAWASYFYLYCDFHAGSLDDDEKDVQEFWRSISMAKWRVKED